MQFKCSTMHEQNQIGGEINGNDPTPKTDSWRRRMKVIPRQSSAHCKTKHQPKKMHLSGAWGDPWLAYDSLDVIFASWHGELCDAGGFGLDSDHHLDLLSDIIYHDKTKCSEKWIRQSKSIKKFKLAMVLWKGDLLPTTVLRYRVRIDYFNCFFVLTILTHYIHDALSIRTRERPFYSLQNI